MQFKLKSTPPTNSMKTIDVKISDMHPAIYNPRKISKFEMNHLISSLIKFKVVEPIVLNSNPDRYNNVIGGHQRIKAGLQIGWTTLPSTYINLNEQDERELNIRLNKNTGSFDFEILTDEFEIPQLIDYGFSTDELITLSEKHMPAETIINDFKKLTFKLTEDQYDAVKNYLKNIDKDLSFALISALGI